LAGELRQTSAGQTGQAVQEKVQGQVGNLQSQVRWRIADFFCGGCGQKVLGEDGEAVRVPVFPKVALFYDGILLANSIRIGADDKMYFKGTVGRLKWPQLAI
jgi:hypothetical protein